MKLDFVNNEIVITDPDDYPVGVSANLVGILHITQPDGVRIAGDWNSPDISYSSGSLQPGTRTLRLDSYNQPQEGTYIVEYEIDHPSYTPSKVTKTFVLAYKRKTLSIEEDFDVFTPALFYRDTTSFVQTGFSITTNTVVWSADIDTVGTTTGSSNDFDLAYGGNYYDALYDIGYQRDILYQHTTYSYLTLQDRYTKSIATQADTPPPVTDIVECINDLKDELDAAAGDCFATNLHENRYQRVVSRYSHLIHKLTIGDASSAETLLSEIMDLTVCSGTPYRGEIIDPYDLSAYISTSSGGNIYYDYTILSDVTEVTLVAMNGKTIKGIKLDGIERIFSNGADGDTPVDGGFVVVTGSAPRKFKYGGTLAENQWLRIEYAN